MEQQKHSQGQGGHGSTYQAPWDIAPELPLHASLPELRSQSQFKVRVDRRRQRIYFRCKREVCKKMIEASRQTIDIENEMSESDDLPRSRRLVKNLTISVRMSF